MLALHEAVRVLGGDASGGGVAGTLLSRAIEIWALEDSGGKDLVDHEIEVANVAMEITGVGPGLNGWVARARDQVGVGMRGEEKRKLGLDGEAEEVLGVAMGRRRPGVEETAKGIMGRIGRRG